MRKVYKIQNKKTGEFATANSWSKNGKSWNHIGHIKNHINEHCGIEDKYHFAELVEYEMVEVSRTPMRNFISEVFGDKKKREVARQISEDKQNIENLKRQINEASKKLRELEKT